MLLEGGIRFGRLADVLGVDVLAEVSEAASRIGGIGVVVGRVGCGVVVVADPSTPDPSSWSMLLWVLVGPADRQQQQLQMPGRTRREGWHRDGGW